MNGMKIVRIECDYIRMPLSYLQVHEHVPTQADHGCVLTQITCENGLTGFGRTYGGGVFGSKSVRSCVLSDLAPHILGQQADHIQGLWNQLEIATHYIGRSGIAFAALSTIDIALWDLLGKALNVPIYKLLGQARDQVPVYASEGWVYWTKEALVEGVKQRQREGYRAYKFRLPSDRLGCVEKMRAVREAAGEEFDLMVDVQNTWLNSAIAVKNAEAIKEFRPFWIEEPVMVQDFDGHALVSQRTGIPVASGENLYSKHQLRDALSKRAFDYAQPDAMRIGGITELQKVIGMCESWFIPAVPHGATEIHLQVALCHSADVIPYIELLTDSEGLLLTNILYKDFEFPKDGVLHAPQKPGLGYTLNEDAIREFTVQDGTPREVC